MCYFNTLKIIPFHHMESNYTPMFKFRNLFLGLGFHTICLHFIICVLFTHMHIEVKEILDLNTFSYRFHLVQEKILTANSTRNRRCSYINVGRSRPTQDFTAFLHIVCEKMPLLTCCAMMAISEWSKRFKSCSNILG